MSSDGFRDYYKILGLNRDAGQADIKKAFRNLARKYHPDINPLDKSSEERFKEINEANDILSDPNKRRKYDQYGKYWNQGGIGSSASDRAGFDIDFGNYGDFDDFVNDLLGKFGGNTSASNFSSSQGFSNKVSSRISNLDAEINIKITFQEAFKGTLRTLAINNERVKVKIPRGIKSGSRLRIKGKGNLQPSKGKRGDLYLTIEVEPHKLWELDGEQLRGNLPVTFDEIALGAQVKIKIPDGEAQVNIPPGTNPEQCLRLKGKGWPGNENRGDLLLTLKLSFPAQWSEEEQVLIRELRNLCNFDPRKDWIE